MVQDLWHWIILSGALLGGLVLRSSLLIRFEWVGKDTFYHLLISRQIRNRGGMPRLVDRFVEPEHYDYPPLLHVALSKIPERWHRKAQFLGPLADLGAAIIVYLFCLDVAGPDAALIAVALYSFTPFAVDLSFYLGPRSVANLLLVVCMVSSYYTIGMLSLLPLVVSLGAASLVLLTQRLAVQSLVASLAAVAIASGDPAPLLILAAAFPVAVLISRGFYVTVLKGHIDFVRVMGSRLLDRETRKEQASPVLDIKLIAFNLPSLAFLALLLLDPIPSTPVLTFALAWAIGLLVMSALWVFGEGYRHMANASTPLAIIGGLWGAATGEAVVVLLVVLVSMAVSSFKAYRLSHRRDFGLVLAPEVLQAFQHAKDNGRADDVILIIPTDLSYHAAYFTGMITAHSSGGFARGLAFNCGVNRKVREGRVNEVVAELGVRWVLSLDRPLDLADATEVRFGPTTRLYKLAGTTGSGKSVVASPALDDPVERGGQQCRDYPVG